MGSSVDPAAERASITINVPASKLHEGNNTIDVIAWNQEGNVRGRPVSIGLVFGSDGLVTKGGGYQTKPADKKPADINFYAIVSGISDYAGDGLDLRYAAKDAEDISKAVSIAAHRIFLHAEELTAKKPCTRVHIRLLSTEKDCGGTIRRPLVLARFYEGRPG